MTGNDFHDETNLEKVLHDRAARLAQPVEEEQHTDRRQLLVLRLGDEWYGMDVGHVREILRHTEITRVPCAPPYVIGVLSVRGEIVSVCDLRGLLGLQGDAAHGPVLIVELDDIVTGITADDIADIVEVPAADVEPSLTTIDRTMAEHVEGEVMVGDRLIALLDLRHLIETEDE